MPDQRGGQRLSLEASDVSPGPLQVRKQRAVDAGAGKVKPVPCAGYCRQLAQHLGLISAIHLDPGCGGRSNPSSSTFGEGCEHLVIGSWRDDERATAVLRRLMNEAACLELVPRQGQVG